MRIIAGEFRGRRLKGPRDTALRPTGDRLKETLFDILGPRVTGSVFADVFAGTGSIGLEALSRGAREVVFVESNPEAARLIRRNLEICGVSSGFRVLRQEAFSSLRSLGREGFAADTVFLDPPYNFEPYADLLDIIFRTAIAREGSVCIIEHHAKAHVPEQGPGYSRFRIVAQSDKRLSFYHCRCQVYGLQFSPGCTQQVQGP